MWKRNKSVLDKEPKEVQKSTLWNKKNSDLLFFKKGQFIYFEGSSGQGVFIIEKGKVKIIQNASNGKEFLTYIASRGDILGYKSLFRQLRHNSSAIAMEDSVVSFISKHDLIELLLDQQDIFEHFMNQICSHTGEVEKKAAKLAYKPVRGRLAEALIHLDTKFNAIGSPDHSLVISRKELASLIGTVKETVIRLLSELKHERLIETHGSRIHLLDLAGLQQISEMYD